MTYVLPLAGCVGDAAAVVGGKAYGLGRLLGAGLPVPPGFAITTEAYVEAVGPTEDRDRIEAVALPPAVVTAVTEAYLALGEDVPVAVRSSATAEDTGDASFAGQQDTYLWVRGADAVLEHVVRCWGSLFTPHAIAYRERVGYADELAMAVVVQQMVDAEAAGVALTLDPMTGARGTVYVEVALGIGEGVVRGDVATDRHWIPKDGSAIRTQTAVKTKAHRFTDGVVRIVDVAEPAASERALSDAEATAVGDLAKRVEAHFGRPMDIEWAVGADREVQLLQARPETVWSRKAAPPASGERDDWDPLHDLSPAGMRWSTTNFGETAPGVMSPLGWTLWRTAGESAIRTAAWMLGAMSDAERATPAGDDERYVKVFYGRAALSVDFVAQLGNRMPGTTGQEAVRSLLGEVPADIDYTATRSRWPAIAWKFPRYSLRAPRQLEETAARTERWWQESVDRAPTLTAAEAQLLFAEAREQFRTTLAIQSAAVIGIVQPLYEMLRRLSEKTGVGDANTLSSGYSGFKEVAVVGELWKAAHGRTSIAAIVREHGFHGPLEGEAASRVWRERPELLEGLLDEYRIREDPSRRDAELAATRRRLEAELLATVPLPLRPAVRGFLSLCARRIPLRGVAKRSFLQSIDVARASARRYGELLTTDGVLDEANDVFYLTCEELAGAPPADAAALVGRRKARRLEYKALLVPPAWKGDCVPVDPAEALDKDGVITGIGVSPGVAEGTVRVLESSAATDFRPDEILVAPTTDPSWSSIMFISAALVVDIGGALSHASMVARELGIPAVVNTVNGTQRLKTGDRVRVDGRRGTVELLER
jgi:phosphohistidine swiveling domain-containing protein